MTSVERIPEIVQEVKEGIEIIKDAEDKAVPVVEEVAPAVID